MHDKPNLWSDIKNMTGQKYKFSWKEIRISKRLFSIDKTMEDRKIRVENKRIKKTFKHEPTTRRTTRPSMNTTLCQKLTIIVIKWIEYG